MNIENIRFEDFKVNEAYPEVTKNINIEPQTLKRIIDAYVGGNSEWTAVGQYIYQSFITNLAEETKHLSDLLMDISVVEMKHLSILSQLIASMGADPKFCRYIDNNPNICEPWSTRNVKYIKDVKEFIEYNIKIENDAIREYNEIINMTEDKNIKEVIGRIIKDERSHVALFNVILQIITNKEITGTESRNDETIIPEEIEEIEKIEEIVDIDNIQEIEGTEEP